MIQLYLLEGIAYVWNAKDWHELRSKHRICGTLIGCIASHPRQNEFLGLPMALKSVETALLLEKGICQLAELPGLNNKPKDLEVKELQEAEKRQQEEQNSALNKKRIEQFTQKIDFIIAGKKKKMIQKGIKDPIIDKESLIQEEIAKLKPLPSSVLLMHLPVEHQIDTEQVPKTISDLLPSVLDGSTSIQYAVFKDLWEKGYMVTDGAKFGTDFLVYPEDPVKFHATYMVKCVCDKSEQIYASSLVNFGRLAVNVNKLAVLATVDLLGQVKYQTLIWHESLNG